MRRGEFAKQLPTVGELAVEYEVARLTMQRAVGVLKEEGVVTAAPGRGIQPTRLRRGRTHIMGLVVGANNTPLGSRLVEGMAAGCRYHEQTQVTECYGAELQRQQEMVQRLVEERQVDGLVLWLAEQSGDVCDWAVEYLQYECVPFVLVPEPDTKRYRQCHTVSNKDSGAAGDVMTHLIARGYRRIRFVGGDANSGYEAHRYERYRRSMAAAGLQPSETLVVSDDADFAAALRQCDAVFCATDTIACRVLSACLQAGISVPGELAVTGYDNTPAAEMMGLTTVEQHFEQMGRVAVDILMDDVEGRCDAPQHRNVESELIVRKTT